MKIIAHRGASRECPENTMAAFQRAIEIGADAIETDVQQTDTGILVLHHDLISQKTSEALPTLEELLILAKGRIPLCLELKTAGLAPQVLELVRKHGVQKDTHVTSFLYPEILQVRKLGPGLSVSVTFSEEPGTLAATLIKDGIFEISLARSLVSKKKVAALREMGLGVRVYTVNDPQDAACLESWGADAIFTDDLRAMQFFRR